MRTHTLTAHTHTHTHTYRDMHRYLCMYTHTHLQSHIQYSVDQSPIKPSLCFLSSVEKTLSRSHSNSHVKLGGDGEIPTDSRLKLTQPDDDGAHLSHNLPTPHTPSTRLAPGFTSRITCS